MNIVIATGIYPPDVGGPAQYARGVKDVWEKEGHRVLLCRFNTLRFLPSGARHFVFFAWVFLRALRADFIFIPDTWSAAVPAVAAGKLLGKKTLIRTGGDFLWEQYVERTGDLVLLRHFYAARMEKINAKEKLIFRLVRFLFRHADAVIFSTMWQRALFREPYQLNLQKCHFVENHFPPRDYRNCSVILKNNRIKIFTGGTRDLKWKNIPRLQEAFRRVQRKELPVELKWETGSRERFLLDMQSCYAVVIASLGDISPNTILEAISFGKPFILTRETGLYEKLKDIGVWVNPESVEHIAAKIEWLCDEENYNAQVKKVQAFTFTHTWEEIAGEILAIRAKISIPNF